MYKINSPYLGYRNILEEIPFKIGTKTIKKTPGINLIRTNNTIKLY